MSKLLFILLTFVYNPPGLSIKIKDTSGSGTVAGAKVSLHAKETLDGDYQLFIRMKKFLLN